MSAYIHSFCGTHGYFDVDVDFPICPECHETLESRLSAAEKLVEAASDVVAFCDKVEGVASHARCVVKRKYIDRLDEALAAYEASKKGSE